MATQSPVPTVEKTFRLSVEADAFLQRLREEKHAESDSEALEALFSEQIAAEKLRAIDEAYTKHYDSLSGEEIEEERAWGALANKKWLRRSCWMRNFEPDARSALSAARRNLVGQPSDRPSRQR